MSLFRPCIDLHDGCVKQIVGGSLSDDGGGLRTNFVSSQPPEYYAELYRRDALAGGHVIMLGPGNEEAARRALAAWPGGLQIGGGIRAENAGEWLEAGASHVIVTSWLFDAAGNFLPERLAALVAAVGRERLVLDLSCRREPDGGWVVAMNRWQTRTGLTVSVALLDELAHSCAEFLVHAADVEGQCRGMDEDLLRLLGSWNGRPVTYAGGARHMEDLQLAHNLSNGRVDVTIGSALDIFGGSGVRYADCVAWNRQHA
jgi:phosphoribosylformimino-5-aminoimidazole carboxamide ribotide isomerase